jgi:ionotropic glutamate receptor
VILYVIARFSPYEWVAIDSTGCILENQFTGLNCAWYALGALLKQSTEISPKAPSTKFICLIWNFFTLILISSYTANLAAFLTAERLQTPIENAEGLSKQTEVNQA